MPVMESESRYWTKTENHIDHRSYARQGKLEIPTIQEGADARKIDEKFQNGQTQSASWKVMENQIIKRQNALLKKIQICKSALRVCDRCRFFRTIKQQNLKQYHDGDNEYSYCNLLRKMDKINHSDEPYSTVTSCARGLYWNPMLSERLVGRTRILLKKVDSSYVSAVLFCVFRH